MGQAVLDANPEVVSIPSPGVACKTRPTASPITTHHSYTLPGRRGHTVHSIVPLGNHAFCPPKVPFQNRSFSGLTALSVKICTDATHRRSTSSVTFLNSTVVDNVGGGVHNVSTGPPGSVGLLKTLLARNP